MICRIWNFVAFIGIVHIYGLFKLTSSSILRGERYSNRDWSYSRVDLLLIQLFGNVLDRFVLGENIGLCERFSCYLTLHHARCFARIVLHVQPLRLVWDFYITYLLSEKIVDV